MVTRTRRPGFSLIELLIVVAIIAALVGVAVPFFNGYMREARSARVREDLDTFVSAIQRHQFDQKTLFGGSRLEALVGSTLTELPVDPWGNPYFFDGNLGVVGTFGSDGVQGGEGEDADLAISFSKYFTVLQAQFKSGGFGHTQVGHAIEVRLSKPVQVLPGQELLVPEDLVLVPPAPVAFGMPLSTVGYAYVPAESDPAKGRLAFKVAVNPPAWIPLQEGTLVALSNSVVAVAEKPCPAAETGLVDPGAYVWGPKPSLNEDGTWQGAPLTR